MLAEFLTFTASCGQSDASDPILAEICTIVTVFDDTNIGGRKVCLGGRFGLSKKL